MVRFMFSEITVEPFMFLCMHAFFLSLVAFPQITLDNVCLQKHNSTKCAAMLTGSYKEDYDIVQEQSTLWFGGLLVTATFITVLTLPFVGTVSDQFGRYTAMFLTPVSQLLQALVLTGVMLDGLKFPTWVLLLTGCMPGFVGDVSGLYVLTGSYISDITSEKTRTLRIALLESAALVAGLSATLCSGFIIEGYGYVGIYVTNIASLMLALLYLVFCVKPVTRPKRDMPMPEEIDNQDVNFQYDKDEDRVWLKSKDKEMNVEEHVGQELKTNKSDGRQCGCEYCSMKETRENVCIGENSVHECYFTKKEEETDILDRNECELIQNHVNRDIGSNSGKSSTGKETCCRDEDDSVADCGMKEVNEKTGKDTNGNEDSLVGESYMLYKTRRTKASKCISAKNGAAEQNLIDMASDIVLDDVSDRMEENIRIDKRSGTRYDSSSSNFQRALLQPEVAVIFRTEHRKISIHSKVLHILSESNPVRNLKRVRSVLKEEDQMFTGFLLSFLIFLNAMSYSGEMSVLVLFLKNRPYFFSPRDLGFYMAYESGILAILGMAIFNYLFTRVINMEDHHLLLMSFCFSAVYYILLSIANSLLMLYLIQLVHSIGSLSTCVIRSLLTKLAPESTVGLLFGALLMSETAGVMFGSLICPAVYSRVATVYPGAVFVVNAGLSSVSIVITIILMVKVRNRKQNETTKGLSNAVGDED